MSNWGDCSNRAYVQKMLETAAKHPPNEPATRQVAVVISKPTPAPAPFVPSVPPQPRR